MIAFLRGKVLQTGTGSIVLDVNGIGYEVVVDSNTLARVGNTDQEVGLYIRTVVREDSFTLYGFTDEVARDVFDMLLKVASVGPKLASQVMSGVSLPELIRAVRKKDLGTLTGITGVGRKLADRITLELSDKFMELPVTTAVEDGELSGDMRDDVRSALVNMGFRSRDVEGAVGTLKPGPDDDLERLIKHALASLKKGART